MAVRGTGRVLVAVAALALLAAPPTEAKKKKKPKSPPVTVVTAVGATSADNQNLTLTASCPIGKIAVGGGIDAPPFFSGSLLEAVHFIYESRRSGSGSWTGSALREDAPPAGPAVTVTAYVQCRTPKTGGKKPKKGKKGVAESGKKKAKKLKVTEVTASAVAPGNTTLGIAAASCPGGQRVLGGGFSSSPPPTADPVSAFPLFYASQPASNAWLSGFFNVGAAARTVTSHAYCAKGVAPSETTGSAALPASGGPVLGQATASTPKCPKGKALLGGGFSTTPFTGVGSLALLTSTSPSAGTWRFSSLNLASQAGTINAHGICL